MSRLLRYQELAILLAIVLTAFLVVFPVAPVFPNHGLDPSWRYGLNEAISKGLLFGRDIIFTFGPYASVYTGEYHPETAGLLFWGSAYLAISYGVVSWFVFRRRHLASSLLFLFAIGALQLSRDGLFFFYYLLTVEYVRAKLPEGQIRRGGDALKLFVVFSPLGFFPLVKGSLLALTAAIVLIVMVLLFARREAFRAGIILGSPVLTLLFAWSISGQEMALLSSYFAGMSEIVSGYTGAMSSEFSASDLIEIIPYCLSALLLLFATYIAQEDTVAKIAVTACYALVLFLGFKAGFVRHGGHAMAAGSLILLTLTLVSGAISTNLLTCTVACVICAWGLIDAAHIKTNTNGVVVNLYNRYIGGFNFVRQNLSGSNALSAMHAERVAEIGKRGDIKKMDGGVDIFSYDQAELIASRNFWQPRPIFQSYSAYTPQLAERNMSHFSNEGRPRHVLFNTQPIDGRLPAIEDGVSWLPLLLNYLPVGFVGKHLHLEDTRKHSVDSATRHHELLSEKSMIGRVRAKLGEAISVPGNGEAIFAKIVIKPSILGRLQNILFKQDVLLIKVKLASGKVFEYRVISKMLESGFVISPLVLSAKDFALLYDSRQYMPEKRVTEFNVSPKNAWIKSWFDEYDVVYFSAPVRQKIDLGAVFAFSKKVGVEMKPTDRVEHSCDGVVDYINDQPPQKKEMQGGGMLTASGWLAKSIQGGLAQEHPLILLRDSEGEEVLYEVQKSTRPDLAVHFGKPGMSEAGFEAAIDARSKVGKYEFVLAYFDAHILHVCSNTRFEIKLNSGV